MLPQSLCHFSGKPSTARPTERSDKGSQNDIRDISHAVDMTPTWFYMFWVYCYIIA